MLQQVKTEFDELTDEELVRDYGYMQKCRQITQMHKDKSGSYVWDSDLARQDESLANFEAEISKRGIACQNS
ncbi:MAG: hypothetical protein ACXABY_12105 [Candidatus Thorarchaeota archaeon]